MRVGARGGNTYFNYLDATNRQPGLDQIAQSIMETIRQPGIDEQTVEQAIVDAVVSFTKGNGPSVQLQAYAESNQQQRAESEAALSDALDGLDPADRARWEALPETSDALVTTIEEELDAYTDEEVELLVASLIENGYVLSNGTFDARAFVGDQPAIESGLLEIDPAPLALYGRMRESVIFASSAVNHILHEASQQVNPRPTAEVGETPLENGPVDPGDAIPGTNGPSGEQAAGQAAEPDRPTEAAPESDKKTVESTPNLVTGAERQRATIERNLAIAATYGLPELGMHQAVDLVRFFTQKGIDSAGVQAFIADVQEGTRLESLQKLFPQLERADHFYLLEYGDKSSAFLSALPELYDASQRPIPDAEIMAHRDPVETVVELSPATLPIPQIQAEVTQLESQTADGTPLPISGLNPDGSTWNQQQETKSGVVTTSYSQTTPDGRDAPLPGRVVSATQLLGEFDLTDSSREIVNNLSLISGSFKIRQIRQSGQQIGIDVVASLPGGELTELTLAGGPGETILQTKAEQLLSAVNRQLESAASSDPRTTETTAPFDIALADNRKAQDKKVREIDALKKQVRQQVQTGDVFSQEAPTQQSDLFAGETTGLDAQNVAKTALSEKQTELSALKEKAAQLETEKFRAIEQTAEGAESQTNLFATDSLTSVPKFQLIGQAGLRNWLQNDTDAALEVYDELDQAEQMEKKGRSVRDIFAATGWVREVGSGKWQYEIPDVHLSNSMWKGVVATVKSILSGSQVSGRFKLLDLTGKIPLFDAYPNLANYDIDFTDLHRDDLLAGAIADLNWIGINIGSPVIQRAFGRATGGPQLSVAAESGGPRGQALIESKIAHEIQHAIQSIEGFGLGGGYEYFIGLPSTQEGLSQYIQTFDARFSAAATERERDMLTSRQFLAHQILDKGLWAQSPYQLYRRLAGEIYAHAVEHRVLRRAELRKEGKSEPEIAAIMRELPPLSSPTDFTQHGKPEIGPDEALSLLTNRNTAPSSLANTDVTPQLQTLTAQIQTAFPDVRVMSDPENYSQALSDSGATELLRGQVPLGFLWNNTVYLSPQATENTVLHEFGHLWLQAIKTSYPELHARGLELVRNSPYMARVTADAYYATLPLAEQLDEALAMAIGDEGVGFLSPKERMGFGAWLSELWNQIKQAFGFEVSPQSMTAL